MYDHNNNNNNNNLECFRRTERKTDVWTDGRTATVNGTLHERQYATLSCDKSHVVSLSLLVDHPRATASGSLAAFHQPAHRHSNRRHVLYSVVNDDTCPSERPPR